MAKVTIFHASVNPMYWDVERISKISSFDDAVEFFENETIENKNCNVGVEELDLTQNKTYTFHADGVCGGDGSDTMFNWIKVEV